MKPSVFRNRAEICHRKWLGETLGMDYSTKGGIDLIDNEKGIELKSRYKKWFPNFAVHEYEIYKFEKENTDKELFWAFLLYDLTKEPKRISNKNIEDFVFGRDIWFMNWDWIKQFPTHYPKTGPYVYASKTHFPPAETFQKFERNKGNLYVPKGSLLEQRLSI